MDHNPTHPPPSTPEAQAASPSSRPRDRGRSASRDLRPANLLAALAAAVALGSLVMLPWPLSSETATVPPPGWITPEGLKAGTLVLAAIGLLGLSVVIRQLANLPAAQPNARPDQNRPWAPIDTLRGQLQTITGEVVGLQSELASLSAEDAEGVLTELAVVLERLSITLHGEEGGTASDPLVPAASSAPLQDWEQVGRHETSSREAPPDYVDWDEDIHISVDLDDETDDDEARDDAPDEEPRDDSPPRWDWPVSSD